MDMYEAAGIVEAALERHTDEQLAMMLFEEIGTRSEVIEYLLNKCPATFDYILDNEIYIASIEKDEAQEIADWRMGRC